MIAFIRSSKEPFIEEQSNKIKINSSNE